MFDRSKISDLANLIEKFESHAELIWAFGEDDVICQLLDTVVHNGSSRMVEAEKLFEASVRSPASKRLRQRANETDEEFRVRTVKELRKGLSSALKDIRKKSAGNPTPSLIGQPVLPQSDLDALIAHFASTARKPPSAGVKEALIYAYLAHLPEDRNQLVEVQRKLLRDKAMRLLGHCLAERKAHRGQSVSDYEFCQRVSRNELSYRLFMRPAQLSANNADSSGRIRDNKTWRNRLWPLRFQSMEEKQASSPPQSPQLTNQSIWLSLLLCGVHRPAFSLNMQRVKRSARSFMRCFELEAALEERTYRDFREVYTGRLRQLANSSSEEAKNLESCTSEVNKIEHSISRWMDHTHHKGGGAPSAILQEVIKGNLPALKLADGKLLAKEAHERLGDVQRLLQNSKVVHHWIENTFSDTSIDIGFDPLMRQPWKQIDRKFGTWVRRVKSGLVAFLATFFIGIVLTAGLSAIFLPTEAWFWLSTLFAGFIGILTYYTRRHRLKRRLDSPKQAMTFLDPDRDDVETVFHLLAIGANQDWEKYHPTRFEKWTRAWPGGEDTQQDESATSKRRRHATSLTTPRWRAIAGASIAMVLLAIVAIKGAAPAAKALFASAVAASPSSSKISSDGHRRPNTQGATFQSASLRPKKYAFMSRTDDGHLCLLDQGVTLWPGPGDYILLGENNHLSVVARDAVASVQPAHEGLARCDRPAERNFVQGTLGIFDSRIPARSIIIPFHEDVAGCGRDDWQRGSSPDINGARLGPQGKQMLQLLNETINSCTKNRNRPVVLDIMGFASEKEFECDTSSTDVLNLELAEYRREQVIEHLRGDGDRELPSYSLVLDPPDEFRWGGSRERMAANRMFGGGVSTTPGDRISRYVEIRIKDGGDCFNER